MEDKASKMFVELEMPNLVILGTFALGAMVLILGYLCGRRSAHDKTKHAQLCQVTQLKAPDNVGDTYSNSTTIPGPGGGGPGHQKRVKNKKRREIQHHDFSHPWMVGAFKGHTGTVFDLDFSADNKFLASCADDRTVQIWCTKDLLSKERKSLRVNISFDFATHVRVSPDGKAFIIHKSLGNNVEVYGLRKKSNGFFVSATSVLEFPKRHEEDIVGMDMACNGRFIMTCSKSNDIIVWDLKGELLATIDTYLGSTHKARISPCGRFVAASGFTPDVKVWEIVFTKTAEFKQVTTAFNLTGHSSGVYDFDFCADSSLMASVSKDATYRFYDTKVEFEKGQDPRFLQSGQWDNATPTKLALSPNGEVLVIAHGTALSFYSTVTGQLDTTIENNGYVACLKFDASGEFLLAAVDRQIRIFRNIAGYRAAIESAKRKLEQRQTSATKERLEKVIDDSIKFLEAMGEHVPE